ncbi:unnamed protein product [marine sediment metagenome]|uniref:Uncharacterized protein n=1 Tax=marine sediment metagenome TaxID=412755 RepID=X0V1W0_9ZZZZ
MVSDRTLRRIQETSFKDNRIREITLSGFDGKIKDNYYTCWKCWISITGEGLNDHRSGSFADNEEHSEICPLCGYSSWMGYRWFPFKFLAEDGIGNPSKR